METKNQWQKSETDTFWGEIAPCDHVVQIYEDDGVFLDALTGFVGGGIKGGDCVIVIATQNHLNALEKRLQSYSIRVDILISESTYIPVNAEEMLAKIMVNNWPDEDLFNRTVSELIEKANSNNRRVRTVRAFGEMVALVCADGNTEATIQLEHLWNRFCEKSSFCLFCAYPENVFTNASNTSLQHICGAHSKLIRGSHMPFTEVQYKAIE